VLTRLRFDDGVDGPPRRGVRLVRRIAEAQQELRRAAAREQLADARAQRLDLDRLIEVGGLEPGVAGGEEDALEGLSGGQLTPPARVRELPPVALDDESDGGRPEAGAITSSCAPSAAAALPSAWSTSADTSRAVKSRR
jgi:hypothetical protein